MSERFRRDLRPGLANLLFINGRYADAGTMCAEAFRIDKALNGPHLREVAVKLVNDANNDTMLGGFERANERCKRTLNIHHDIAEGPNQTNAAAHNNYATSLAWHGQVDKALEQQRERIQQ